MVDMNKWMIKTALLAVTMVPHFPMRFMTASYWYNGSFHVAMDGFMYLQTMPNEQ